MFHFHAVISIIFRNVANISNNPLMYTNVTYTVHVRVITCGQMLSISHWPPDKSASLLSQYAILSPVDVTYVGTFHMSIIV